MCADCTGTAAYGPLGTPEPISTCNACGVALHSSCASRSSNTSNVIPIAALVKRGSTWLCNDCQKTGCDGCHTKDSALGLCLLGCCGCDKHFHLGCLDPLPEKKPKSPWRCRHCLEHHATKEPELGRRSGLGLGGGGGGDLSRRKSSKVREKR